jgi:hypothetical protein
MENWLIFFLGLALVLCFVMWFLWDYQIRAMQKDYKDLADYSIQQNAEILRLNKIIVDLETKQMTSNVNAILDHLKNLN